MKNQKTKLAILGLLTMKPLSGYEIKKLIEKSIGHFWSESNGQLYPTLNKLLKAQLISLSEKSAKGKKISLLYSITKEGLALVKEWLKESTERKNVHRDEELLKLFFGMSTSKERSINLLEARKQRIQEKLNHFKEVWSELTKHIDSPQNLFAILTLKNGIAHAETDLMWCQESIQTLTSLKEDICPSS